eukprot:3871170-Pleurochrysis_carterae.AAC.1
MVSTRRVFRYWRCRSAAETTLTLSRRSATNGLPHSSFDPGEYVLARPTYMSYGAARTWTTSTEKRASISGQSEAGGFKRRVVNRAGGLAGGSPGKEASAGEDVATGGRGGELGSDGGSDGGGGAVGACEVGGG